METSSLPRSERLISVFLSQKKYFHMPRFQRTFVWPEHMKAHLIRVILKNRYIPAIIMAVVPGEKDWYVIDGQQRLGTIISYMNNEFSVDRRRYDQLSSDDRELFDDYMLGFVVLYGYSFLELGELYLDINRTVSLSPSERLFAHNTVSIAVAEQIINHPFFSELLVEKSTKRKKDIQTALYPMLLQVQGGWCHASMQYMGKMVKGSKDDKIDKMVLFHQMKLALDKICHLYSGVRVGPMMAIILLYQSVLILDALHINSLTLSEGVLKDWYRNIEEQSSKQRQAGFFNLFVSLAYVSRQYDFWLNNLDDMLSYMTRSSDISISQKDIAMVRSWLLHKGLCQACNAHVKFENITAHSFGYNECIISKQKAKLKAV